MTVYRNHGFSQLLTLVAAVFAAGSVVLAISRSEATTAGRWAPAAVVIAISAFCYLRLARAGVHVERDGDRLLVSVSDDGRGGATDAPGGGLAGLRDRVRAVDGPFALDTPPAGGTTVTVEVPCAS